LKTERKETTGYEIIIIIIIIIIITVGKLYNQGDVEKINLAEGMDQLRAVVAVSCEAVRLMASQEVFSSWQLVKRSRNTDVTKRLQQKRL
jgi:hypothetical protein